MNNKNTKNAKKAKDMHAYTIALPDDAVRHVRKTTHVDAVASAVRAFIRMDMTKGAPK